MLRPATDADSADLLRWRNHPEVRAVSLTRHEITEAEHAAWWATTKTRGDRAVYVYVYVRYNVPSGVVTFFDIDEQTGSAAWGYYLDNAGLSERGELLPAWVQIQREAKRLAFDTLGLRTLEGEVLESNEAVRRMNRRNGFAEVETYTREIDGTPTRILRVRATSDSTSEGVPQS